MKISYKAIYCLLETKYARVSSLQNLIKEVGEDIYNASILFAKQNESYEYLDAFITQGNRIEEEYALFTNFTSSGIILLKKDVDLSIAELAVLSREADLINIEEFKGLIESTCHNRNTLEMFNSYVEEFTHICNVIN